MTYTLDSYLRRIRRCTRLTKEEKDKAIDGIRREWAKRLETAGVEEDNAFFPAGGSVSAMFIWAGTPEGEEFWQIIDKEGF